MGESGRFLTFDLGAESGRAVLGTLDEGSLQLTEVHRFANEPQRILDRFHWDTVRLFAEVKAGLAKCVNNHEGTIDGIGVDTWGVDYALLDASDELLGQPYHYRDHRTDGIEARMFDLVPRQDIYRATGIQFMQLNTLVQLMSMRFAGSKLLDQARTLLMIPDLLNFWLTGNKAVEQTIASTTQCYDPQLRTWARPLLDRLGLPHHFLGEIVEPGTRIGTLHSTVRTETGAGEIPVIAPASHDTGSAVAAVPAEGERGWAYISCGTWSLVGVETREPYITPAALEHNLTNEGGVNGTTRLLRNVMGLWLLQQCKKSWERHGSFFSYDQLSGMAARALPFRHIVDPDDPSFLNPDDMAESIAAYCRRTGQPVPDAVPAMARCINESLALKYRWVIERLEAVTGDPIETIHIIGGGCQNAALCQATADATGRRVLAGPVEATALGNILVQAISAGRIGSIAEGRAIIARSFPLKEYLPKAPEKWEKPYEKFLGLMAL